MSETEELIRETTMLSLVVAPLDGALILQVGGGDITAATIIDGYRNSAGGPNIVCRIISFRF